MAKIKDTMQKAIKSIRKGIGLQKGRLYVYETKEDREATATYLFDYAKSQREDWVSKWRMYDDYYQGKHVTQMQLQKVCEESKIPWIPAIIPDPYIHVESQIIPDVPDFQFNGRDDDIDSAKAKQREYVVKYVMENNKLEHLNTKNERRLNKLGNAFWKVCWDSKIEAPGFIGDIVIGDPDAANIFPDPSAYDIDDCEYIDYAYRVHKMKAQRMFKNELEALGTNIEQFGVDGNYADTEIYNSRVHDIDDDTVQIVEHWFRQPEEGKETIDDVTYEWESGDIACSILVNEIEIKYIPKYWLKTGKQCKMYPFVKYCKIPDENNFWDKSELAPILDLVDAADRELAYALLNSAFMSNDITLMEENAMADGSSPDNRPGALWKVKAGQISNVRRLGGIANAGNKLQMIEFIRSVIQETVGNFDSAQGKEPVRVTTASGIAQLNERADARKSIKKADRLSGFERLYELIDWTALEYYDDDRLIFIGVKDDETMAKFLQNPQMGNMDINQGPVIFRFNSDNMRVLDDMATQSKGQAEYYYPRVDAVVNAGDGLQKSKAFTLSATENLLKTPINQDTYKIVESMIDIMDLPNKKEIRDELEGKFGQQAQQMAQQMQMLQQENQQLKTQMQQAQQMQAPQQPQMPQINIDEIMASLSPEEQQAVMQNPQLLEGLG